MIEFVAFSFFLYLCLFVKDIKEKSICIGIRSKSMSFLFLIYFVFDNDRLEMFEIQTILDCTSINNVRTVRIFVNYIQSIW